MAASWEIGVVFLGEFVRFLFKELIEYYYVLRLLDWVLVLIIGVADGGVIVFSVFEVD